MYFTDTHAFVQERIREFHAQADHQRRLKALRQSQPTAPQPRMMAQVVRLAQVALTLGR